MRSNAHRPPTIEVIARAIIQLRGHILVCRNLSAGHCYLPGGHVEFGETGAAAAERELLEECGLRVQTQELVLVTEECFRTGAKRHHEVNLHYRATGVFHVERRSGAVALPTIVSREPGLAFEWMLPRALKTARLLPRATALWLHRRAGSLRRRGTVSKAEFITGSPWKR